MQTFLPHPNFHKSFACLDSKRAGNQVYREGKVLIEQKAWLSHPASKMWRDYIPALALYCLAGLDELKRKGRNYPHWYEFFKEFLGGKKIVMPYWLGDNRLHSSHRRALLYKNYDWYSRFRWIELPAIPDKNGRLPYFWP